MELLAGHGLTAPGILLPGHGLVGGAAIITASAVPVLGPLVEGDMIPDHFTTGTYHSTAGDIVPETHVSREYWVDEEMVPADDPVVAGQEVYVKEVVTDSEGTTPRTWRTVTRVVEEAPFAGEGAMTYGGDNMVYGGVQMVYGAESEYEYDTDAAAYIAAVETADDEPLEEAVTLAIDGFVRSLKEDGIWSLIDGCCILAGARTLTGALVPLRGATPTAVNFVSDDYNRKTGLKGNGSNKRLLAGPRSYTQNDAHLSVWFGESFTPAANSAYIGNGGTASGASQLFSTTTAQLPRLNFTGSGTSVAKTGAYTGFYGASRNNGSNVDYRLGGSTGNTSSTSAAPNSNDFVVFCRGTSGAPTEHTLARLAWFSHGRAITLATLDSRLASLMSALDAAIA